MNDILVFDPAQCCATGVCGAEVNPVLVRFAADLEWLATQGVPVRRFNLAHEAAAFAENPLVRRSLQEEGTACLPLVLRAGAIVSRGRYPARDELATWGEVSTAGAATPTDGKPAVAAPSIEAACCAPGLVNLGASPATTHGSSGCC